MIVDFEFCQNEMMFVGVTQMYTRVYLHNAILVTEIFCYRYSTITLLRSNIFQWNLVTPFSTLLVMKCTKFYSDLFRFDIFILRCSGGYFFPDTV